MEQSDDYSRRFAVGLLAYMIIDLSEEDDSENRYLFHYDRDYASINEGYISSGDDELEFVIKDLCYSLVYNKFGFYAYNNDT